MLSHLAYSIHDSWKGCWRPAFSMCQQSITTWKAGCFFLQQWIRLHLWPYVSCDSAPWYSALQIVVKGRAKAADLNLVLDQSGEWPLLRQGFEILARVQWLHTQLVIRWTAISFMHAGWSIVVVTQNHQRKPESQANFHLFCCPYSIPRSNRAHAQPFQDGRARVQRSFLRYKNVWYSTWLQFVRFRSKCKHV